MALRTELKNGDAVEIVTAPGARPNPGWLNFVRTGRARSKIRHHLKTMEQEESRSLGEKLLAQALRAEGLSLPSTDPTDTDANAVWQQLTRWSGNRGRGELLTDIGLGRKIATIVAKRMAKLLLERGVRPDAVTLTLGRFAAAQDSAPGQGGVIIDGSEGASVQLATCCRPIPGDAIVGYLGRGEGLLVHTAECHSGKRLADRDPERWIAVEWAEQRAAAISQAEADIVHIGMDNERDADVAELRLLVSLRDRQHLADVLRTLKRANPVLRAGRVKP